MRLEQPFGFLLLFINPQLLLPGWAQKEYERFAVNTSLWKQMQKLGDKDFLTSDFEGIRKTIQEKSHKVEVSIALD